MTAESRRRVYVAGPMRGYALHNFPAFDAARGKLEALGFDVISPADLDRENGFDGENVHPDGVTQGDLREFMRRDTNAICDCDAVGLLEGWAASAGVRVELELARFLGLRIFEVATMEDLD